MAEILLQVVKTVCVALKSMSKADILFRADGRITLCGSIVQYCAIVFVVAAIVHGCMAPT